MLLGFGRRTMSCWLRAAGVSDDSPTKRCGPKMQLAAELVEWCVTLFKNWFRKRVMEVACGAYAKRPFLKRVKVTGAVVVRVTVLDDQIIRGVGILQIRADVQNAVSFCVLLPSGSPADAELWSIGVGRRHSDDFRPGRCERNRGAMATAHSLLPESAGSRSPERRR